MLLCCCCYLRVVASRTAASLEPQLSKSYGALLLATAVDFYGSAQLIQQPGRFLVSYWPLARHDERRSTYDTIR